MTFDMLLNIFLLLYFGNIYFILAAGNLGYMLSHVLALSGVLLLRKDRPNWPRPIRLAKPWMVGAGVFAVANLMFIIFGVWKLKYTGYGFNYLSPEYAEGTASPTERVPEIIAVGAGALAAAIIGYVIAQHQHGRPFRWKEPSAEQPSQEAIVAAAIASRAR